MGGFHPLDWCPGAVSVATGDTTGTYECSTPDTLVDEPCTYELDVVYLKRVTTAEQRYQSVPCDVEDPPRWISVKTRETVQYSQSTGAIILYRLESSYDGGAWVTYYEDAYDDESGTKSTTDNRFLDCTGSCWYDYAARYGQCNASAGYYSPLTHELVLPGLSGCEPSEATPPASDYICSSSYWQNTIYCPGGEIFTQTTIELSMAYHRDDWLKDAADVCTLLGTFPSILDGSGNVTLPDGTVLGCGAGAAVGSVQIRRVRGGATSIAGKSYSLWYNSPSASRVQCVDSGLSPYTCPAYIRAEFPGANIYGVSSGVVGAVLFGVEAGQSQVTLSTQCIQYGTFVFGNCTDPQRDYIGSINGPGSPLGTCFTHAPGYASLLCAKTVAQVSSSPGCYYFVPIAVASPPEHMIAIDFRGGRGGFMLQGAVCSGC